MNSKKTNGTTADEQPAITKRIGKTTYQVKVYFSQTSKETMTSKIFRMLHNEVSQSPKM